MKILLCFFMLIGGVCFGQSEDAKWTQRFLNDRQEFQAFEQKHRRYVQTDNVKLSFLSWGCPNDQVFIWLPGSLLSAYDFQPFANELLKAGFFVISVDHYGHGMTPIPKNDADFFDFATDLRILLDSLKVDKAIIGGFSRGAYLATAFYNQYPNRVKALVLEDGGSVSFKAPFLKMNDGQLAAFLSDIEPNDEIKKLYFDFYDSPLQGYLCLIDQQKIGSQFQVFGFLKKKGDRWISYQGLDRYMGVQDSASYRKLIFQPESLSAYAGSIALMDPSSIYENLQVPMLIMEAVGEPDLFDVQAENQILKEKFPRLITHQVFDQSSHNIHYAQPEKFRQTLLLFLESINR